MYDALMSMYHVLWTVAESVLSGVPAGQRNVVTMIACIALYGLLITQSKR